jgi:hypothetical protein
MRRLFLADVMLSHATSSLSSPFVCPPKKLFNKELTTNGSVAKMQKEIPGTMSRVFGGLSSVVIHRRLTFSAIATPSICRATLYFIVISVFCSTLTTSPVTTPTTLSPFPLLPEAIKGGVIIVALESPTSQVVWMWHDVRGGEDVRVYNYARPTMPLPKQRG